MTKNYSIDESNVGIVGHSQGGWLAQIAAAEYPKVFRFGISLSGPAVSVLEQVAEIETSRFLCKGLGAAEAKAKALESAKAVKNLNLEWLRSTDYGLGDKDLSNIKLIKDFDPRPEIKKIKIPFLFVYGETDEYVYPTESIESSNNLFACKLPENISTLALPGSDHSFRIKEKCFKGDVKNLKRDDKLSSKMKSWVERVLEK